jgi:hypothetical protein
LDVSAPVLCDGDLGVLLDAVFEVGCGPAQGSAGAGWCCAQGLGEALEVVGEDAFVV